MKVVGIIVEYNPLHNGHAYHFQEALKATGADACVAVMSGNFLQRGEPAIVSKWARTKMALALGIDLVLELPTAYCAQNAETFAFGAISTLHSLGIVDSICFGSESGETDWLEALAEKLIDEPEQFKSHLKESLDAGQPYPAAYAKAAAKLTNASEEDLQKPNNILGLNYLLALKRLNSPIKAYTIARVKAGYNDTSIADRTIASATALRKLVAEKDLDAIRNYVPSTTFQILLEEQKAKRFPVDWNRLFPFVRHQLLSKSASSLAEIHEMTEGIEHRLKRFSVEAKSFEQFMEKIKTKRYTRNRLQRLLLYILLHYTKNEARERASSGAPYIRALGFNQTGRMLLREAKKRCDIPIIAKIQRERQSMLDLDMRAANIYQLAYDDAEIQPEHACRPIIWE